MELDFAEEQDMKRRPGEEDKEKGKIPDYGEEETISFQQSIINSLQEMSEAVGGEQNHARRDFSPVVRRILSVLRMTYAFYLKTKDFLTQLVSNNWGYSAFFFILLFLLMLYPLVDLLWYLLVRAIISLAITLIVRGIHFYCAKLLAKRERTIIV